MPRDDIQPPRTFTILGWDGRETAAGHFYAFPPWHGELSEADRELGLAPVVTGASEFELAAKVRRQWQVKAAIDQAREEADRRRRLFLAFRGTVDEFLAQPWRES